MEHLQKIWSKSDPEVVEKVIKFKTTTKTTILYGSKAHITETFKQLCELV